MAPSRAGVSTAQSALMNQTSTNDSDAVPLAPLLERARSGDHDARNELFERCRAYVSLVARAQVGSWLQAKVDHSDLVQQTLLEAHRGLDQFRGTTDGEWLAWLKRMVHHNAADLVRRYGMAQRRRAGREVSLDAPRGNDSSGPTRDPSDPGQTPSQIVLRAEEQMQISRAVAELPPDYQEVIILRNLERLPFDEVAERMGRSRPAVQMLWMRALKKLNESLEP
jgi:RNA polymerase sigma-70 factor (ECF subfamily)